MSAGIVLERLEGVKQRGRDQWSACCPAHGDKTPSLSIKETESGHVLVHCFAGCGAQDILESVGLTFESVMPEKLDSSSPKRRSLITPRQAVELISQSALFVAVCAADIARGEPLSESTKAELFRHAGDIQRIRRELAI